LSGWQRLRHVLSRNPLAVAAYAALLPTLSHWRLKKFSKNWLYHSPNFLVPPFDGPIVTTFHDLSIQRFPQFHPKARVAFMEREMRRAVDSGAHIITDAELVRRETISYYGISPSRVSAIHLGASEQFHPRDASQTQPVLGQYGLRHGQFFLFTSTIEPRKNIVRICAAYQRLRQMVPDMQYPIIFVGGAGWHSEQEHAAIADLERRGWGAYLGFAPAEHLPVLYAAAAALVFPSIYEGFGLPALEAQRSGCPVITSLGSTMAEFSADADLLVEPQDEIAISEALQSMWQRSKAQGFRAERQSLSANARQYTWQKTAQETAAVYQHLDRF